MGSIDISGIPPAAELVLLTDAERQAAFEKQRSKVEGIFNNKISNIVSASEVQKTLLLQEVQDLQKVEDAEVEACKHQMRSEVDEIRKKILFAHYEGKAGPFVKLPVELLSHILNLAVELDVSPWLLVSVSKQWERTALATPTMWRYIRLFSVQELACDTSWKYKGKVHYTSGKYQVLVYKTEFESAVSRAGIVSLDIQFLNTTSSEHWAGRLRPFLYERITAPPFSSRLKSVRIRDTGVNAEKFKELPLKVYHGLERLIFEDCFPRSSHLCCRMVPLCPNLVEFACPYKLPDDAFSYSFWERLKVLRLSYRRQPATINFDAIAKKITGIEVLEIYVEQWPQKTTPRVSWPHLVEASMECDPTHLGGNAVIGIDRLTTLRLHDTRKTVSSFENSRKLSSRSLQTFKISTADPGWLSKLSLQAVETIHIDDISVEDLDVPQHYHWSPAICPKLHTLILSTTWEDKTLIFALECITSAQVLRIEPLDGGGRETGMALFNALTAAQLCGLSMCRDMRSMTFGSHFRHVNTLKKHANAIKKFVTARKKSGRPIQIEVYWAKGREVYGQLADDDDDDDDDNESME